MSKLSDVESSILAAIDESLPEGEAILPVVLMQGLAGLKGRSISLFLMHAVHDSCLNLPEGLSFDGAMEIAVEELAGELALAAQEAGQLSLKLEAGLYACHVKCPDSEEILTCISDMRFLDKPLRAVVVQTVSDACSVNDPLRNLNRASDALQRLSAHFEAARLTVLALHVRDADPVRPKVAA